MPEGARGVGDRASDCAARPPAPWSSTLAPVSGDTGARTRWCAGRGTRRRRLAAGGGRGRGAAPALEHVAQRGASAGHHHLRRLPDTLSRRLGPRVVGRGRILRRGAASSCARCVDGMERRAAHRPSAPGGVPEPIPHPSRGAVSPSGEPCAGAGAASGRGGLRDPLSLLPVAGGDLRRARARRRVLPGSELRARRRYRGTRALRPRPCQVPHGEVGLPLRAGPALAPCARRGTGRGGALAQPRRRPRQCTMGDERARRRPVGRQALVGAAGAKCHRARIVSGPCVHRRCGPRGNQGLLPPHRPSARVAGDTGAHRGAASRAHHRAHARARHRAVHPGRDGPELRNPCGL